MWKGAICRLSLLLLLLAGCEVSGRSVQPEQPPAETGIERLVWPQPPAPARIRYVRSIAQPRDLGIVKSFFGKLLAAITGKTDEPMIRPTGVSERNGVVYIADAGAQAVRIFDPANQRSVKVHEVNGVELSLPVAVADRPDGSVFVADSGLKKVFLLDREGGYLRTVAEEGLERPAGLAYDEAADRLYVADSAGQRIVVYASDGKRLTAWGKRGLGDGEFNFPSYLALDRSGNLLVTDALNYRVQAFNREGKFLWKMGRHGDSQGDFAAPKGLGIDNEGHIYVVDALFDAVQILDQEGALLLSFGSRGTAHGEFWLPSGAFINRQDRIYVADSYNQRIQVFEFLGGGGPPQAPVSSKQGS